MTTCVNPRCGNEFPNRVHAGRPVKYCNRSCKNKHWEAVEYTPARTRYIQSDKGKASLRRRVAKWSESDKGLDSAKKTKIQNEIYRIVTRLSREPHICKTCRDDIDPMTDRSTYCCQWCSLMGDLLLPKEPTAKVCPVCETTHYRRWPCCSVKCRITQHQRQPGYTERIRAGKAIQRRTPAGRRTQRLGRQRRRARERDAWVEDVDVIVLAEWQRWKCYLCSKPISKDMKAPDPMSCSLDHLVPLSVGGEHSYANCVAAHFGCNSRKQARPMNEQLKLC